MKYKIIITEEKGHRTVKLFIEPSNEALDIYIGVIDKYLMPIFIEHHILSISFPQQAGVINYYKDLDWEDLSYIEAKFDEINHEYIYIYTYIGITIDNIMLKNDFNEIYYHYSKAIYLELVNKDISEIQEYYSKYISWWLDSYSDDPNSYFRDQYAIYSNMNISWKTAMEQALAKFEKLIVTDTTDLF